MTTTKRRSSNTKSIALQGRLSNLLKHQEWQAIRELFLTRETHRAMVSAIQECSQDASETLLHYCCRFHPPIDVVMMLYKSFPQAACLCDKRGRYAVHLACREGAAPSVIRFLSQKNPHALSLPDHAGSIPLHYACEYYERHYDPELELDKDMLAEDAAVTVIEQLCSTSPDSVNIEDGDERNAVEIAIECEVPWDALQKLQKTSEKDWKRRTENGTAISPAEDLQRHVQEQLELVEDRVQRMMTNQSSKKSVSSSVYLPTQGRPRKHVNANAAA